MNDKLIYDCGDLVRLKSNPTNSILKFGDCGIVWGVYSSFAEEDNEDNLVFDYEGAFWNENGDYDDLMFEDYEVEKISNINETPFPEKIREFIFLLENFEANLKE